MDVDVKTYMKFLRENVSELNRLGKEWGMTEDEISSCIERALQDEPKEPVTETNMSLARKTWHWIRVATRWTCIGIGVILALLLVIHVITIFHAPSEMYVSGLLQPYGYAIFRAVRLMTLPLHDHFNITNLYDSECLVDNPWFQEPEYGCELCESIKTHLELESNDVNRTLMDDLMDRAIPVVFKGMFHHTVTYDVLHQLYTENKEALDKSVHFFQSSVEGMETIADLFKPDVGDALPVSEGVTIHWQTKNMLGGQVIRKIFPRPPFVPAESEVALEKTVFLDGPKSDHYELASSFMQIGWYTQAQNDRKVLLAPLNHCRKSCNPIQLKLNERDILMFSPTVWKVILMPNKKGISVGFMGSFSEPA